MYDELKSCRVMWSSDCTLRIARDEDICEESNWSAVVARSLEDAQVPACVDIAPAHDTVTLWFDASCHDLDETRRIVQQILQRITAFEVPAARRLEIPTCFGGAHGADMTELARECSVTESELVELFCDTTFTVRFLGFMPGFPYLTGLPDTLNARRLDSPRTRVPAGSVAIAGKVAGIYPVASPGGWRVIGRTSLQLFDPRRTSPALLTPGDTVRFVPITSGQDMQTAEQPLGCD